MVGQRAYDSIAALSQEHQWTHADHKQVGLGKFIIVTVEHPQQQWTDTRPEWMSQMDLERLSHTPPLFPIWWDQDVAALYRRQRPLQAAQFRAAYPIIQRLVTQRGMFPSNNPSLTPHAMLSYFMEAWGQGCITPMHIPFNPRASTPRKHAYNPVAW